MRRSPCRHPGTGDQRRAWDGSRIPDSRAHTLVAMTMEYVRLGGTGLRVSRVCLGMMSYGSPTWRDWVLDEEAALPLVRRAVELGVTFFDTADMYSLGASEEVTGNLLRTLFDRRDDYVLATKVYQPMGDGPNDRGLSRKHVLSSIDDSLRRLGTDHVDLYQTHRWDYDTPIEETMSALHDVVRAGKARYLGASSMYAWQFAKAQHVARVNGWTPFKLHAAALQPRLPGGGAGDAAALPRPGVGVIPWSPLARGVLAGTRGRDGNGGPPGPTPTASPTRSTTSRTSPWSTRSSGSPTCANCRRRGWPSPG